MGPRPWRPAAELDAALERGDLRYAIALADELRATRGRPVGLDTATRFLPLIACESPREYDAYALRWLARWLGEAGAATIERAAVVTALLAGLPRDDGALERLRAVIAQGAGRSSSSTRSR
jgi:hypothetical protein